MPDDEQAARIRRMRTTVKDHNVFRWAANLLSDLTDIRIELPERQENVIMAGEVATGEVTARDEQEEVRP
jgi:trehalose-6-phosphate synthase